MGSYADAEFSWDFFLFLFVGRNGFECYEFPVCVWMWMSVCMRVCAYCRHVGETHVFE